MSTAKRGTDDRAVIEVFSPSTEQTAPPAFATRFVNGFTKASSIGFGATARKKTVSRRRNFPRKAISLRELPELGELDF
jgi:hypothetical protein